MTRQFVQSLDVGKNEKYLHVFRMGFPGQYYDQETGLHYNYFRYYDPQTGRYITPDPIGLEGGINLWPYVEGNPVNRIDRKGLQTAGSLTQEIARNWPKLGPYLPAILPIIAPLILNPVTPGIVLGLAIVAWPSSVAKDEATEDEWAETHRRLIEKCHEECVGKLGQDPCSQGIPYTNCMKECMGRYGFGYPWPNSPVTK